MASIDFRAVTKRDIPLLKRWVVQPHWQEWWDAPDGSLAEILGHLDSDTVEPMIAELDGRPVAYVQSYDPHLEDGHPYQDQPFGTLGLDIAIGEAADLNKGLGTQILIDLAALLFEEGSIRLVIDPHPDNKRAIRAYEKAGFVAFDTRTSAFGPALIMARDNPESDQKPE